MMNLKVKTYFLEKGIDTARARFRPEMPNFVENQEIAIDKNDFSFEFNGVRNHFDGVFMIVHGTPGEDGILQGYFQLMGIPFTTGDVLNMAITFNKPNLKGLTRISQTRALDAAVG